MRTLINVCGASFSGTTMLDLMLGNADDAASCGEVGAWYRPRRHDRVALSCPCGSDPCPRWGPIAGIPEARFHREAFDRWGVRHLVDSTKRLSWVVDANRWAAAAGVRVVNLLIWKDPGTHAYSHWKRGTPIPEARRRFVRYHDRFVNLGLPFASVRYDDFVRAPAAHLVRLCRVADLPYFDGKERFWSRPHHNLFGNPGTRDQLGRTSGAIRPVGPFPPEFARDLAAFEASRGPDWRIHHILKSIRRREVTRLEAPSYEPTHGKPGAVGRYWYFEDMVKQTTRNLFGRLRPARPATNALA